MGIYLTASGCSSLPRRVMGFGKVIHPLRPADLYRTGRTKKPGGAGCPAPPGRLNRATRAGEARMA